MDEPITDKTQPEPKKEWLTPELIIEEVKEVTHGGRGDERLLASEDKVTTYYHS